MGFTQNCDKNIPQQINEKIVADALTKIAPNQKNMIDSVNTNILGAPIGKTHICHVMITFRDAQYPTVEEKYNEQW